MTHEPPIPEAATPPYPAHPAPMPERKEERRTTFADEAGEPKANGASHKAMLGAAVGIGSAALLAALLYARRGTGRRPRKA